jgi:hypothetical protein
MRMSLPPEISGLEQLIREEEDRVASLASGIVNPQHAHRPDPTSLASMAGSVSRDLVTGSRGEFTGDSARVRGCSSRLSAKTSHAGAPGRGVPGSPRGGAEADGFRSRPGSPGLGRVSSGGLRREAGAGEPPVPAEPAPHPAVSWRTHKFTDLTPDT